MAGVDANTLAPELRGSLGAVAGLAGTSVPHRTSLERIVEVAAFGFDVEPEVLLGPRRTHPLVHWRQITLAAARLVGHSYPAIAAYVGCDHSTVIHAVRRVASQPAWSEAAARIVAWASTDESRTNERGSCQAQSVAEASGRVDDELAMRRRAAAADAAYPLGHSWVRGPPGKPRHDLSAAQYPDVGLWACWHRESPQPHSGVRFWGLLCVWIP